MASYRKLYTHLFQDEKVRALSTEKHEKLLCLYLWIEQSNRCGLFIWSKGRAADDLGLPYETMQPIFDSVVETMGWGYDDKVGAIYIKTWFKYNTPQNNNQLIGALSDLSALPKTLLMEEFSLNLEYIPAFLHRAFKNNFPRGQVVNDKKKGPPPGSPTDREFFERVLALYHSTLPELPKTLAVRSVLPSFFARVKEYKKDGAGEAAWWSALFDRIKPSDFLMGRKADWKMTLGWLLLPRNMGKVLNGAYEGQETGQAQAGTQGQGRRSDGRPPFASRSGGGEGPSISRTAQNARNLAARIGGDDTGGGEGPD